MGRRLGHAVFRSRSLLIVIVVGAAMLLMRRTGPTAREILDRRYAAGEISKEQYEQMKRDLA